MTLARATPGTTPTEERVIAFPAEHRAETGRITKWILSKLVAVTGQTPKTGVGKFADGI